MKIRYGFVSNSSSASFVIVGFDVSGLPVPPIPEEYENEWEDDYFPWNEWCEYKEYDYIADYERRKPLVVIGKVLANIYSDSYDNVDNKEYDLLKVEAEVREIMHEMNLDLPIKIYTGTRSC